MKTWMSLCVYFLTGSICFASYANTISPNAMRNGFFLGLGASYHSINLTQNSWGKGVSNIITSTGANSNGVAEGDGAPFHNITNTLSPDFQVGYFQHIAYTPNFWGVKFLYQYLDTTATNSNLFIPQIGQTTSAITGVTTPLYGWVNADSVQPATKHEMALLLFAGQSFYNASFYLGAGPAVVNLKSRNYYSIGYAEIDGATINVTGLVSYASPSLWVWGGSAQLGATYFVTPCWFIDMSYTYTITAHKTVNHQQTFTNSSSLAGVTYTTSGTLYTKNTMRVKDQSLMLTINRTFDF